MLEIGLKYTKEKIIKENESAKYVESGDLEVFSTPSLIAFMENCAMNCVKKYINENDTTVGISINIKHLQANLIGEKIKGEAKLTNIDGRKLTFEVLVTSDRGEIGKGIHERFIVSREKFINKLKKF
ncbi:thioesterase superfamily protein [Hypnocyclicus thermotrophus]|uniref:Thioesterase superfamily protein n=1 Tax=Hypnocyclicus thermotrophus TaxID=1627895 RepID=A0AA46E0H2_9FUSO|nr:thioesterase family protein [Hypnocyclicus thermotrophus]TDT72589.1 thioesterase superfamily protein [Hypnocyclicus thermotrophus]